MPPADDQGSPGPGAAASSELRAASGATPRGWGAGQAAQGSGGSSTDGHVPPTDGTRRGTPGPTVRSTADPPGAPKLPPGYRVELPGRGTTFVRDAPGPHPDAPVVLLLHGLGATADLNWWHSYAPLQQTFRVLAIDHRGHGRGIRSHRAFRLADCADDAVAAARALGVERFIAVGYSMGGPIAQLIWYRHRPQVSGLVLCATSRDFRGSPIERLQFAALAWAALGGRVLPWSPMVRVAVSVLARRIGQETYGRWMLRELQRNDVGSVLQAAAKLGRFTSREWIGAVDVPVGVVATSLDSLVPVRRQVKLALSVPSATIHVAEGDHYLSRRERDAFVSALLEACRLVARRAGALGGGVP